MMQQDDIDDDLDNGSIQTTTTDAPPGTTFNNANATVATPEENAEQAAAAAEASKHVGGVPVDAQQSNALASAILGAWLAKYGASDPAKTPGMVTAPVAQPPQLQVASVLTMAPTPQSGRALCGAIAQRPLSASNSA